MRLITSRIMTKSVSLEDALKVAPPKIRSLDEILATVKQTKTAAAEAAVVTAAVKEEPKVEVKAEPKVEVVAKAETKVEVKTAEFKEEPKAEVKTAQPKKPTLKMASSLDFRNWEAKEVVSAWGQHGTVTACMKNTADSTNNPKLYCELLQVAASVATEKIQKTAKTETPKTEKVASGPSWKKFAKLAPKEKQLVVDFFSKLYGKDYVEAMVTDY